ncbi:MAG: radical SAM protein [Candidatus Aureabacteria bacterium]|nr:radical SAM protein [Candidatus Auribacterota bacterium]
MINVSVKRRIALALRYPGTARNFLWDRIVYRKKMTPYPRSITCFVTEKCNFNCRICHVKESRQREMGELAFEDLKRVIDEAEGYVPSFQLSGGEPLLHPDLGRIIRYLTDRGMVKGVVTNGSLLEERAEELVNAGLDFLAVSLDGPDEETHDARAHVKGSFGKIINGIRRLVRIRGSRLFPNVRIATVVSRINLDNFDRVLDIAEELGVDQWSLSHNFYYPWRIKKMQEEFAGRHQVGRDVWGECIGDREELFDSPERNKIREGLHRIEGRIAGRRNRVRVNFQKGVAIESYYAGAPPSAQSVCTSPYRQLFIRGNGDVEICQGYVLGNIKEGSIFDFWRNEKAEHFREILKKYRIMPACFRCCALEIRFD